MRGRVRIRTLLASSDAEDLCKGLELARQEIARLGSREAHPFFEIVSAVFHLEPFDRPDDEGPRPSAPERSARHPRMKAPTLFCDACRARRGRTGTGRDHSRERPGSVVVGGSVRSPARAATDPEPVDGERQDREHPEESLPGVGRGQVRGERQ